MTTLVASVSGPAAAAPGVTARRVTNSEWIKFRTLRSTWFSLGAAMLVTIALGVLITALRGADIVQHGDFRNEEDWTRISLGGVLLAQLAVAVLGVLMITGEYSTGMIRASLSAVPHRNAVLLAKAAVLAVVTFVLGTIVSFTAFLGGQATIAGDHFGASLSSPGALRAVIGGGLYLALVAMLGLGLGFIFRNTGGALAALFGLLLILPLLVQAFPSGFRDDVSKFLPLNAGIEIMSTQTSNDVLSPWAGIGVFALYVGLALGVGWVVLRRRDA
jgi:ABC-2 type transport system permease protein